MPRLTVFPHRNYKAMFEVQSRAMTRIVKEHIEAKGMIRKLEEEIKIREKEIAGLKIALTQRDGELEAIRDIVNAK